MLDTESRKLTERRLEHARSIDTFLALYTRITKEDIRRNRNNVAERLGFLGG